MEVLGELDRFFFHDGEGDKYHKNENCLKIAVEVADLATCARHRVGAVIVGKSMEILSSGRNGVKSGERHCVDIFGDSKEAVIDGVLVNHAEWSGKNEIHAEINAINFLPDNPHSPATRMYVTHSPCVNCTTRIISEKKDGKLQSLEWLYFSEEYDGYEEQVARLQEAGIKVGCIRVRTHHLNYPFVIEY